MRLFPTRLAPAAFARLPGDILWQFSDADMEDPALLKELGEVSGELEFGDDGDGDGDGDDDGGDDGGKELSEAQGEETPGRKEADPFAGTLKVVAGGRTSVDEDVPVKPEKVPDAMEGIDDDDCSDLDELMAMEDKVRSRRDVFLVFSFGAHAC